MVAAIRLMWLAAASVFASAEAVSNTSKCSSCRFIVGAPVNTTSGRIFGHPAHNATKVSEYLGIPFAQPPVGQLRFAPPVAYTSKRDILATRYGHNCPSYSLDVPKALPLNVYNILAGLAQVGDDQQEDCLYVNVWSKPQTGSPKKPVLVWIYGGGYNSGGTNGTAYSGQFWADQEDVVFVSFNYRVNIFGFPGAPDITHNAGLLDQRMAIEWVRDNIAAFGGDADRITIFGQSAGAGSADLYNYAWHEDPIIAGSILQSGTAAAFGNRLPTSVARSWFHVTEKLGCGNASSDHAEVLACMRSSNITSQQITNATYIGPGLASVLGNFGPTVDGRVVFENYTEQHLAGKYIKKPVLVGNNNLESGLFKLIAAGQGTQLNDSAWNDFDQHTFTCPASTAASFRRDQGVRAWRYYYSGMFPNVKLPTVNLTQAWHGAELLVMFGTSEEATQQDSNYAERALGSYLRGAWAAFAACPSEGLLSYGWRPYDRAAPSVLLLGGSNTTVIPRYGLARDIDTKCGTGYYPPAPNM